MSTQETHTNLQRTLERLTAAEIALKELAQNVDAAKAGYAAMLQGSNGPEKGVIQTDNTKTPLAPRGRLFILIGRI